MKQNIVMLNGQPIEAVVFGDGQQQIDLFNTVAAYAHNHKLEFKTAQLTPMIKGMQQTLIVGQDKRYTIQVRESKIPGIEPPFHCPSYLSMVTDKTTGETKMHYGTISRCFWDLLHELKDKQK